jgi:hypothetical protein
MTLSDDRNLHTAWVAGRPQFTRAEVP